jgi:hypothetical protein
VAVLVDHRDSAVVVHRDDHDRAKVLDDFSGHDLAAGHPDPVSAQRENLSDMQALGRGRLKDVLTHG